jgi:hypothetical protein
MIIAKIKSDSHLAPLPLDGWGKATCGHIRGSDGFNLADLSEVRIFQQLEE